MAVGEGKVLFSTIAEPGMFALGIVPKEVFLTYSTQFISLIITLVPGNVVMVAIDKCGKSPITGEWIYWITWKHVVFMFFIDYLFVCLIISLHFYICHVWFILANNRLLVLILELFLFLKFIAMFLPVNMHKFCKKIFNSYCNWYIRKQSFKGSP